MLHILGGIRIRTSSRGYDTSYALNTLFVRSATKVPQTPPTTHLTRISANEQLKQQLINRSAKMSYGEALHGQQTKPNPMRKHIPVFVAFVGVSFMLAVYSIRADNPELLIAKLDQQISPILGKSITKLIDTLKRKVIDSGYLGILVELVKEGQTFEIRQFAAKVIGNLAQDDSNKVVIARSPQFLTLVSLVQDTDTSLYVKKTLAHVLASCATVEFLRVGLAIDGVPSALYEVQQKKLLKRKYFELALRKIADTVTSAQEVSVNEIRSNDMKVIKEMSTQYGDRQNSLFSRVEHAIVNSGVVMYLHTSLGGLLWGAFESLRRQDTMHLVIKNSIKTSVVTGLVPICFVGIGVSLYNHYHRRTDTAEQRFYLTFATCMSLYPWYYLLPRIENFSPFWIGGHVVGFMSFFIWMVLSGNDLFKTDSFIVQYDQRFNKK